eukprot:759257-Hanusia_phi.AAC.5
MIHHGMLSAVVPRARPGPPAGRRNFKLTVSDSGAAPRQSDCRSPAANVTHCAVFVARSTGAGSDHRTVPGHADRRCLEAAAGQAARGGGPAPPSDYDLLLPVLGKRCGPPGRRMTRGADRAA